MPQTSAITLDKSTKYKLNNGTEIPIAAFGVYQIEPSATKDSVYTALKIGYRHIDSAAAYKNEAEAAAGIAAFLKDHPDVKREDIWFTTKIWNDSQGYEETKAAIKTLADKVKSHIEYVDLVLIHSPKTSKEKRLGSWRALLEFNLNPSNGVLPIRSIGVSNYGIPHLKEIVDNKEFLVTPVVNQLELHPWLPRLELREFGLEHHILFEAYNTFTRGKKFSDPEVVELSEKYNISKPQMLLRWAYLQGFIVIVKSEKPERIEENYNTLPDHKESILGKIDLNEEIIEKLNKPDSKEVFTWGGEDPAEYKD